MSFGQAWRVPFQSSLRLPCFAVGLQPITTRWLYNGTPLQQGRTTLVLGNSSIRLLQAKQGGEYACEVENSEGADRYLYRTFTFF